MTKPFIDDPDHENSTRSPGLNRGPRFEWKSPEGEPRRFLLSTPEVTIGRQSASDLVLPSLRVSRRQAKLLLKDRDYEIIDLESRFGTFVNGRRIERRILSDGDLVTFGNDPTRFTYLVDEGESPVLGSKTAWVVQDSVTSLGRELPSAQSDLEKVLCVLDFQQEWLEGFTPESAFDQILESAIRISGAERGFILLGERDAFRYTSGRDSQGRRLEESGFRASQTAVGRVIREERPLIMIEGIDSTLSSRQSIVALGLRALACLPLRGIPAGGDAPEILGILYLDSTKVMHSLSGLDERILAKLAVEAGNVLERLETLKAIEQRKRIEADLARAEETQLALLPRELPSMPGFELRAFSKPTRFVGGDFYHFQQTEAGDLIGVLADVSGKGVSASLVSSMLLGCLQLLLGGGAEPRAAFERLNAFMYAKRSGHFATMFLFRISPDGTTRYISAGHNPAYLFRAATREVEEARSTGLILGPFHFASFEEKSVRLEQGDVLVVYSDGLTEAENPAGEHLGESLVKEVIRTSGPEGADRVHAALLRAVQNFTGGHAQNDDITLVIAGRI
jgi:serine phosphatase RsbU (regulator of sigma subunit)